MALENYHEPYELLTQEVIEEHRAIASLIEELEAAHWYGERRAVTQDEELRAILEHHRGEELEHAAMLIEWLRRKTPRFDEELKTYLNTTAPITEVEEEAEGGGNGSASDKTSMSPTAMDLGIGSMRKGG